MTIEQIKTIDKLIYPTGRTLRLWDVLAGDLNKGRRQSLMTLLGVTQASGKPLPVSKCGYFQTVKTLGEKLSAGGTCQADTDSKIQGILETARNSGPVVASAETLAKVAEETKQREACSALKK